jgi:Rrf2 family protein
MLSQSVESALRAVIYLAGQNGRLVPVAEVADAVVASRTYLAKTLGQLTAAGILKSSRGAAGGFRVARALDRLTLAEIAAVLDGTEPRRCLLGTGICGQVDGCAAHQRWAPIAHAMDCFFTGTTVSDLLHTPRSLP